MVVAAVSDRAAGTDREAPQSNSPPGVPNRAAFTALAVGELDLGDRRHAHRRVPDRDARDALLAQRRVEHALCTELLTAAVQTRRRTASSPKTSALRSVASATRIASLIAVKRFILRVAIPNRSMIRG